MLFKIQLFCTLSRLFSPRGNRCRPLRACAAARMQIGHGTFESIQFCATEKLKHQNRTIIKEIMKDNRQGGGSAQN